MGGYWILSSFPHTACLGSTGVLTSPGWVSQRMHQDHVGPGSRPRTARSGASIHRDSKSTEVCGQPRGGWESLMNDSVDLEAVRVPY